MKKALILSISILALAFVAYGFGGPAPSGGQFSSGLTPNNSGDSDHYIFDDFEDGDSTTNPEWWKFDNINLKIEDNSDLKQGDPQTINSIGKYSLRVTGTCTDWYCGGIGTYIARKGVDLSRFNMFQMDVYGNGPGSGTIKIELNDDDNGNWQPEQDPKKNFANMYDDKFVYNLTVDWRGWKRVQIPIADFADENPGIGDDIWNPNQEGGSGGLIQMQLIFIGAKRAGTVNMNLDNIGLAVK